MTENSKLTKRQIAMDAIIGGATHKEAAALIGMARQTVSNWAWEDGVCVSPRATDEEIERAMDMLVAGRVLQEIADALGYHESTVRKWAQRRGLSRLAIKRRGLESP